MTEETPEVTKCTANPDGYGASFCQGMASTLDFNPTKQSKGMVVNLCPFCGGPLRDISND